MELLLYGIVATAASFLVALLIAYRGDAQARSLLSELRLSGYTVGRHGLVAILLSNAVLLTWHLGVRFTALAGLSLLFPAFDTWLVAVAFGAGAGALYAVAYRVAYAARAQAQRVQLLEGPKRPSRVDRTGRRLLQDCLKFGLPFFEILVSAILFDWAIFEELLDAIDDSRQQKVGWCWRWINRTAGEAGGGATLTLRRVLLRDLEGIVTRLRETRESEGNIRRLRKWAEADESTWLDSKSNEGGFILQIMARAKGVRGLRAAAAAELEAMGIPVDRATDDVRPYGVNVAWKVAAGALLLTMPLFAAVDSLASSKDDATGGVRIFLLLYIALSWLVFIVCFALDSDDPPTSEDWPNESSDDGDRKPLAG